MIRLDTDERSIFMISTPEILYEDDSLIVVNKPAGLPVETRRLTETDLVSLMKTHVKGGYIAVINRLDQPVEGLLLFAKNKKSASALSKSLRSGQFEKIYLALVEGHFKEQSGTMTDRLLKDGRKNMSFTSTAKQAKKAVLTYRVLEERKDASLLEIHLETGRHHQIRVQLSSRSHALLGDRKYGTGTSPAFPALAAAKLSFPHPVTKERLSFQITPSFL